MVCWHFLLAALGNLWMMYVVLLRTGHSLAFPVCKAELHVFCKGHVPTREPAGAAPSPIPLSTIDPDHTWISWEVGDRGVGRASEVWSAEKPHGRRHLMVTKPLWRPLMVWKNSWILVAFRECLGLEKLWKKRQDLSLPNILMVLRWFPSVWTKTTSQGDCMNAVCGNIMCAVPGERESAQTQCPWYLPLKGHQLPKPWKVPGKEVTRATSFPGTADLGIV